MQPMRAATAAAHEQKAPSTELLFNYNIIIITTIAMGVLSLAFSWHPKWINGASSLAGKCKNVVGMLEDKRNG